ncbi:MAG: ECF transporter S component [Beduini sp.]|uniref:ECF transporter S component n=1 Tax=Beduini sp. TaxID=1922300 RepID=UPI0039907C5D
MNKIIRRCLIFIGFPLILVLGIRQLQDRQYTFVSIVLVVLSLICFYFQYELQKPKSREIVLLAVMITIVVLGRLLFILTPSFKPTLSFIIIYAAVFGKTSGFVCGSLSAFIANFFFGQGPWTPFQMLSCGIIGYFAGWLLNAQKGRDTLQFMVGYGILSAVLYSLLMEIWNVIAITGTFDIHRYLASLIASLPISVIYMISNCVFIVLLAPVMTKKMKRIKWKYGLCEGGKYEKINQ